MAKLPANMKKAYAAYEKAESKKEKMMEAKKGSKMLKKVAKRSMLKKMGKKK